MQKLYHVLICLFTCSFCLGQGNVSKDFTYNLGTPYRVIDAETKYYFTKGDEVMTVKIDKKTIYIQKLDAGKLSFIKIRQFENLPKGAEIETVDELAGRYYLYYSLWDDPHEQLFAREIDFASGEFTGKDILLIRTDRKITRLEFGFGFGIMIGAGSKFTFQYTYDRAKLLVQYRVKPEIKDDDLSYDIIGMNVFDKELSAEWKKEVKMPYTEKKMNNIDYSLDGEGNAFLLATVYDDNTTKLRKDEKPNYHIELIKVQAKTGEIRKTQVGLGKKFINKVWLYENSKRDMICAGYYTQSHNTDNADGIFMFKVDKSGQLYDIVTHEIPVSVLNQYQTEKQQKKNEKNDENDRAEFTDLELRKLIVEEDGSVVLIGEQYYSVTTTSTYYTGTTMRTRTTTKYYYNDILITKLDPKGGLAWMQKLGKRQQGSRGKGGMSFAYMGQGGNHYMLFLDNEKNLDLALNQVPVRHMDGVGGFLTAYKVNDASGQVSKLSIFDMRDVKGTEVYQFHTDRIVPMLDNSFVVEVYKKKKEDVLIKVALEK